jgi:hypothetical protein
MDFGSSRYADADCNADGKQYANSNRYSYCDSHSHTNGHSDSHGNAYAYAHADRYSKTYTYTKVQPASKTSANSPPAPVTGDDGLGERVVLRKGAWLPQSFTLNALVNITAASPPVDQGAAGFFIIFFTFRRDGMREIIASTSPTLATTRGLQCQN